MPEVPSRADLPADEPARPVEAVAGDAVPHAVDLGSLFTGSAGGEGDVVLAKVGDLEVRKHHVYDRLAETDPAAVREAFELLLIDGRVRVLAEELGVSVPSGDVDLAVKREWARLERTHEQRPEGVADFGEWLQRSYGLDAAAMRARLTVLAARRLLRAYTLRYWLRRQGGWEVEFFCHADRNVADNARARVAGGADFAGLARQESQDRSARLGGRLPELPDSVLHPARALADGVGKGELSAVGPVRLPNGTQAFGFVRVLDRRPPDRRPFADQVLDIKRELERRPVAAAELAPFLLAN